jgi:hypothetical protein
MALAGDILKINPIAKKQYPVTDTGYPPQLSFTQLGLYIIDKVVLCRWERLAAAKRILL